MRFPYGRLALLNPINGAPIITWVMPIITISMDRSLRDKAINELKNSQKRLQDITIKFYSEVLMVNPYDQGTKQELDRLLSNKQAGK
ncbi:MAG: hypothetical protein HZB54_08800 [Deltaproteobacteria bacterium]|nr:hypothetical protein [Deltaproteobacteria bacterium]